MNQIEKPMTEEEIEKQLEGVEHRAEMYAFYDKKAKRFDIPFFASSDLFAERHYLQILEQPGSFISTFPQDFDVYHLGTVNLQDFKFYRNFGLLLTGKERE